MNINSKLFGFVIALLAVFFWSIYSIGNLFLDILMIALINGANSASFNGFEWTAYLKEFLIEVFFISLGTGCLGWLTAEIYNDFNEMFRIKLK